MIVSLISSVRVVSLRGSRHCHQILAKVYNDDSVISKPSKTTCVASVIVL